MTTWFIDESALVRLYRSPDAEEWAGRIERGRGHHRAASIPDLLIAATAELAQLAVLQDDKDFKLIADVTGQPIERLTPHEASEQ